MLTNSIIIHLLRFVISLVSNERAERNKVKLHRAANNNSPSKTCVSVCVCVEKSERENLEFILEKKKSKSIKIGKFAFNYTIQLWEWVKPSVYIAVIWSTATTIGLCIKLCFSLISTCRPLIGRKFFFSFLLCTNLFKLENQPIDWSFCIEHKASNLDAVNGLSLKDKCDWLTPNFSKFSYNCTLKILFLYA